MKILLTIHHELDPNLGAPGVTWRLGQEYIKLGHDVSFFSFDDLPSFLPSLTKAILFPEFVVSKVTSLLSKGSFDVLDASTSDAWLWAKLSKLFSKSLSKKYPLIVTRSHGLEHTVHFQLLEEVRRGNIQISWKYPIYNGGIHLWEVATSIRLADLVLLLNQYDLQYATNDLDVQKSRTYIVKNGISDVLLGQPLKNLYDSDSKIRIALIGSYIPRKGIKYSVPALNKILHQFMQVEVSFFGTIVPREQVIADFDVSIQDRINVIPTYQNSELLTLLMGHSIHLFPSLSEGFGLAVVEAMACGLVPIVTDIPGPTEIVRHDFDAMVIPSRDSVAIEAAITKLIEDRAYLEKLRINAHTTAQGYSWTNIAKENIELYEIALNQKLKNL